MGEVNLTVSAPKEVVDVLTALDGLVSKIVAKEALAQIVAEEIPVLLSSYSEFLALPAEVTSQSDEVIDAAELYVRRIVYKLLGKDVKPVTVA